MTNRHRILAGLPPYGPEARPFSASGLGVHREGLVVEFTPEGGRAWIGNFQRGGTGLDVVRASPAGVSIVVVAGGQAYVVDPESRRCVRTFGGDIEIFLPFADRLVFGNGLWLEATDGERPLWRTSRLSWDGMRNLRVDGETIVGESYDPMTDEWTAFAVEIATGEYVGGSHPPEMTP